jgi:uncharacterized membrane protein YeaQ/YmgE (transglycosylase-associated protein family)
MTITITALLLLLIIAGICGAIGRAMGGGLPGGFVVSIAVGFVGALVGMLLANEFRLPELLSVNVDGRPFPILWSIIGGALLVMLLNVLMRPRLSAGPRGWGGRRWYYR